MQKEFPDAAKKAASELISIALGDSWYLTDATKDEEDHYYYITSEDGSKTKVTKQYIEVEDNGETVIIYVDNEGTQVKGKWIDEKEKPEQEGFRYVNGDGHVQIDIEKMAGGFYGIFDTEGLWTPIEDTFFPETLDDKTTEIIMYAAKDGKVCKTGNRYYYFEKGDTEKKCYLTRDGMDSGTKDLVTITWIGDLYIGEQGALTVNKSKLKIGQLYYDFDAAGHSTLIKNAIIIINEDTGEKIYVGEDGSKAGNIFVDTEGDTIYFDENGVQASRKWIKDEKGWRYVDGKGRVVKDATKGVGGSYGHFDAEGYWTAIENVFFTTKLDDGTEIQKYSGTEGDIAKNAEDRHYYFVNQDGATYCYLMAIGGETTTKDAVTSLWINDLRINAKGSLICSSTEKIDGIYYSFDEKGHGTAVTYAISYDLGGGVNNAANPSKYAGTVAAIALKAPTRSGYAFAGWYTDNSFTNRITEVTTKNNSSGLVIYAKWVRSGGGGSSSGNSNSNGGSNNSSNNNSSATTNPPPTVTVSMADGGAISSAAEGQNVSVSIGQNTVAATVTQKTEGSVNGNTIVSTAVPTSVTVAEGQTASVATIAVGKDGSARSLLAASIQGAEVKQIAVTVGEITTIQNVVAYADGTQVSQKSGTAEMAGFSENAVAAELAIQSGKSIAEIYNGKVSLNLEQYTQVGSAVTYEVVAGANGAVPQTQMEQTSFVAGQSLVALVTDVNGNVTATEIVVGNGGIVQYQIPGSNCIVRFLQTSLVTS